MKAILTGAAIVSLLLFSAVDAIAQNTPQQGTAAAASTGSKEPTIEELYLQNVAMRIVHEQAIDLSRDSKLLALSSIREMVDNGTIGKNSPAAFDVLGYLVDEGTRRIVMEDNRQINNFPEVRREACNLLGRIGGEQAVTILMHVMGEDPEPMVLSEAAYALGQIGMNPNGEVSQGIAERVARIEATKPDNNLAFAALLAFEKLAKKNNGLPDSASFQLIVSLTQGNYILPVKQKANQVLDELKQYG